MKIFLEEQRNNSRFEVVESKETGIVNMINRDNELRSKHTKSTGK